MAGDGSGSPLAESRSTTMEIVDMKRNSGPRRRLLGAALVFAAVAAVPGRSAAAQTIAEFPVRAGSNPVGITAGPDGNVWFVEEHGDRVGRIASGGAITEFPLPAAGSFARGITSGPDGNLWFTELPGPHRPDVDLGSDRRDPDPGASGRAHLDRRRLRRQPLVHRLLRPDRPPHAGGRLDVLSARARGRPAGHRRGTRRPPLVHGDERGKDRPRDDLRLYSWSFRFPILEAVPSRITVGPDGNLWFTEAQATRIGRMTPAGALTEFGLPAGNGTYGITAGADGNVWFTESTANRIGKITPSGTVTELHVPTPGAGPTEIVSGPDGNLWFTEFNGDRIGRIAMRAGMRAGRFDSLPERSEVRGSRRLDRPVDRLERSGMAIPLTSDTGAFWFFTANNVELVVKVVDGRRGQRQVLGLRRRADGRRVLADGSRPHHRRNTYLPESAGPAPEFRRHRRVLTASRRAFGRR